MPALAYEKLLDEKRKRLTRRQSLFEDTHELSTRSLRLTRWPRCAVRDGRCVDTTMRFIPLEGLVIATRRAASTLDWCRGCTSTPAYRSTTSPTL